MHILIIGALYENMSRKMLLFLSLSIFLWFCFLQNILTVRAWTVHFPACLLAHSFVRSFVCTVSQSFALVHYFSDVFLHTYGFFFVSTFSLLLHLSFSCYVRILILHTRSTKYTKVMWCFAFPFFSLLLLCCYSLAAFSTISISWFSSGNRNRFPFFFIRKTLSMSNIFRFHFSGYLFVLTRLSYKI